MTGLDLPATHTLKLLLFLTLFRAHLAFHRLIVAQSVQGEHRICTELSTLKPDERVVNCEMLT